MPGGRRGPIFQEEEFSSSYDDSSSDSPERSDSAVESSSDEDEDQESEDESDSSSDMENSETNEQQDLSMFGIHLDGRCTVTLSTRAYDNVITLVGAFLES